MSRRGILFPWRLFGAIMHVIVPIFMFRGLSGKYVFCRPMVGTMESGRIIGILQIAC